MKKELLIFLTPYIVNDPAGLLQVTDNEINKTDLIEQAFTPRDFNKFLDSPDLFPTPEGKAVHTEVKQTTTLRASAPVLRTAPAAAPAKAKTTRVKLMPK